MKVIRQLALGIVAGVLPTMMFAQESQTPTARSEISAQGTAQVLLKPDRATVRIGISIVNPSARAAASANGSITAKVIQALTRTGAKSDSITTTDFGVQQHSHYENNGRDQVPDGFSAHNTVILNSSTIDEVPALIDAALDAGGTSSSVSYASSKASDARLLAIGDAFTAAKTDALAVARAAGGSLGRLLSATPSGSFTIRSDNIQLRAAAVTSDAGPVMRPGDVTSSVVVSARWEFIPAGSQ